MGRSLLTGLSLAAFFVVLAAPLMEAKSDSCNYQCKNYPTECLQYCTQKK